MPIKATRSKFNNNSTLRIITSFQSPPTYANSLLPAPTINTVDSDGNITIPPIYFAVVDNNNIVENNFDLNTLLSNGSYIKDIIVSVNNNSDVSGVGGPILFKNGIATIPEQKTKYTGSGSNFTLTFNILDKGGASISTFTISSDFPAPINTTTTTTIAGVPIVKDPVNSELLTLILKNAGISYDYRFLINKDTSKYLYSVARATRLYSTNYYIPHWNKEKMGMSWKGSVYSAKYGNGLALVLENYDDKNEFGSPAVLIKRFDKDFLGFESKFGNPDNEYEVVIRNRVLTNSYIDSSSDNITKFLTSNSVINEKYNNIVSTNGRLYFVFEGSGTFLIPTEDQFNAIKIDYTFSNFIPNFEAHKSNITFYNREPLEQKYGAISGNYFNKDINDLSFGIMYVPDQSSVGIGNKTDCVFETYKTNIALIESDTKCPVLTPDGTGLITSNFIKIRDNFYDIKGAIAIFGGYEKYVVITPSNIYVFLSVSLSNSNFIVYTYNIIHSSGISKWTDATKHENIGSLSYQSSDYDSQDIYVSYISNCYELAEPAKFGTDIEEYKKSVLLNGSPIDCVSLLKIPLDIFVNTTNQEAFNAIGTSTIPLSDGSFQIVNKGNTSNFPTINGSVEKVLYNSIPRSVLKTSDSSIPIFYRKAKNPKNNFGFINPNSSVELYGNAVHTYRQYDKCCSQDFYAYKDVVTTPISGTTQVSYVILGTPIINSNGKFVSIPVLNGGSGFVVAPSVLIAGGNGNGATATAIMVNGSITSILITNQGTGYSPSLQVVLTPSIAPSVPAVLGSPIVSSDGHIISIPVVSGGSGYSSASLSIIGGGGSGFIANAVVVNGVITSINITNQGNNYNPLPTIIVGAPFSKQAVAGTPVLTPEGNIISIPIIDSGDGYLSDPIISVIGAGSGATFVGNVVGGKLVSIKVENPGIGYLQPLTVTISAPYFSSASLGTAVFSSGSLVSVPIITGGTGYINNPTVLISGGGGSGAKATATVVNGVVTGITITQVGSGYTSAPTITVLNYNASSSLAYDPTTWELKASIDNVDFIKEVCLSKSNLNINFKLIDNISNSIVPLNGWFLLDFKGENFTFNLINKSLAGEPVAVYMANGVIDYSLDPRLFYTSSSSYYARIATDMLIYPANSNTSYSTGNYKFGEYSCGYRSGTTLTSPNTFSIDSKYLYFYDSVVSGTGRSSFAVIQSMIIDKKGNFVVFKQGDLTKVNTYSIKNAERVGSSDVYRFEIDQKNESFSLQNLDNCLVQLKNKPAFNQNIITTDINAIGTFAIKDPYSNLNVAPKLQETINISLNCESQNLKLPVEPTITGPITELRIKYSVSNLFPSYFNPMLTYLSASSSVASNLWRGYSITGNEGDEVKFKYVESDPNIIFNALKKDDTGLFPTSFVGAPPLRNPIPEFTIVLPAAGIYEIEIELKSLTSAGKFTTDCFGPNNQTSLHYIYGKTVLVNIADQFHTCAGENSTYKYKRAFQLYYDGKEIPRSKNRFPENEVSLISTENINQAVQSVRYGYFPPIGYHPIDSIQQNSFHISRYTMPMSISLADDRYKDEGDPDYKVYITTKNQFYFNHEPSRYNINEKINLIKAGDYITHPYIKLRYQGCNPDGTPGNGTSTIPPYNSLPVYQPLDNSFAKVVSVTKSMHLDKFLGTSIVIDTEIDMSNTDNVPLEFLFFTDSSISDLILPDNSGFIDKTKDITLEEVGMPFTGEDVFKEDWCFFKNFNGSFGLFTPESVTWLNDKSKMATEIIFQTYLGSDAGIYSNPAIDYSEIKKANMKKGDHCGVNGKVFEYSTWLDPEETKKLFDGKLRIVYCDNLNYSGSPTRGWVFGGPADFGMNNFSSVLDQIGPGKKYKDIFEAWNGVNSDEFYDTLLNNCDTWKEFKYPPILPFKPASDEFYGYDLYPNTAAIPLKDFKPSSGVWSGYRCVQAIIAKHDPKFVCDNVSLTGRYPKLTISGEKFVNCPFDAMITAIYETPQSIKDAVANKLFKLSVTKSFWIMSDGVTKMAYCSTPPAFFDPNLIVTPTPTTGVSAPITIDPNSCFKNWLLPPIDGIPVNTNVTTTCSTVWESAFSWTGDINILNGDPIPKSKFYIQPEKMHIYPIVAPMVEITTSVYFINKCDKNFGIYFLDRGNAGHAYIPTLEIGDLIYLNFTNFLSKYNAYYRIKSIDTTYNNRGNMVYILECPDIDPITRKPRVTSTSTPTTSSTIVSQEKTIISYPTIFAYSDNTVIITWITDKPSTSRVVYGTSRMGDLASGADYDLTYPNDPRYNYDFSTPDVQGLRTYHSVTIKGLKPNTIYYFRTVSKASPTSVSKEIVARTKLNDATFTSAEPFSFAPSRGTEYPVGDCGISFSNIGVYQNWRDTITDFSPFRVTKLTDLFRIEPLIKDFSTIQSLAGIRNYRSDWVSIDPVIHLIDINLSGGGLVQLTVRYVESAYYSAPYDQGVTATEAFSKLGNGIGKNSFPYDYTNSNYKLTQDGIANSKGIIYRYDATTYITGAVKPTQYWLLTAISKSYDNITYSFKCLGTSLPASAITGTGATFGDPVIVGGGIIDIPVINGGRGYNVPPIVTISGNGSGATAIAILGTGSQSGTVIAISVTNRGSGYTSASASVPSTSTQPLIGAPTGPSSANGNLPSVPGPSSPRIPKINPPSTVARQALFLSPRISPTGEILSIGVSYGGSGYTVPPIITLSAPSPGGTQAQAIAILGTGAQSGMVVGVRIQVPGTGYTTATTASASSLVGATFGTPVVVNGVITSIPILNGGSGQNSPPVITITDPATGASGAVASVTTTNGVVTGVIINSGGKGYTTPIITVTNGGVVTSVSGGPPAGSTGGATTGTAGGVTTGTTAGGTTGPSTSNNSSPTGNPNGSTAGGKPSTGGKGRGGPAPGVGGSSGGGGGGCGTTVVTTAYGRCTICNEWMYQISSVCGGGGGKPLLVTNGGGAGRFGRGGNAGGFFGGFGNGGGGIANPGNGGINQMPPIQPVINPMNNQVVANPVPPLPFNPPVPPAVDYL